MPREVITAPRAALALAEALDWYSQEGAGAEGWKIHDRLEGAAETLRNFPYSGKQSDYDGLYQLVVAHHRFLYTITPDTRDSRTAGNIEIVAIFRPCAP